MTATPDSQYAVQMTKSILRYPLLSHYVKTAQVNTIMYSLFRSGSLDDIVFPVASVLAQRNITHRHYGQQDICIM